MNIDDAARRILAALRTRVDQGREGRLYGNCAKALHDIDALLENPSLPLPRIFKNWRLNALGEKTLAGWQRPWKIFWRSAKSTPADRLLIASSPLFFP